MKMPWRKRDKTDGGSSDPVADRAQVPVSGDDGGGFVHAFGAALDPEIELDIDEAQMRRTLGGKGAGLVAMTRSGLPVPPGFIISTDACRQYLSTGWEPGFDAEIRRNIAGLEATTGKRLGDPTAPLLVSVRSGAEVSMPGMMDTVLNVGMNADVEAALAARTGDAGFAADTWRRAVLSFADVVLGAPQEQLHSIRDDSTGAELTEALAAGGFVVPDDPVEQILAAVRSVFASWTSPRAKTYRSVEGIDDSLGTAATVQAMVFGNLGDDSGTGVAFTRDPSTGEARLMGDFLINAQGEDVVAGGHMTLSLADMKREWPAQYEELERIAHQLENTYEDMVDIEFTVEHGTLWMLQARVGKRSPIAAFRMAIDMAEDPSFPVDRNEAVRRCQRHFANPPTVRTSEDAEAGSDANELVEIASGIAASPGLATGMLCLDPDEALELDANGVAVILARRETSPADVHGMSVAKGLFTTRGGHVSHAAVVARSWGIPAVVGADAATLTSDGVRGPGGFAAAGSIVTVDGDAGRLLLGSAMAPADIAPEVLIVKAWAEAIAPANSLHESKAAPSGSTGGAEVGFDVMHMLRVKGLVTVEALAAMTDRTVPEIESNLATLVAQDHATEIPARSLWRLSEDGRTMHDEALAALLPSLRLSDIPYEAFLALNDRFKQLCTDWQVRAGQSNTHDDIEYDGAIFARLGELDEAAQPLVAEIAAVLPWAPAYGPRLLAALQRVLSGDQTALTGVMCESYHDVWMELHEDLIITQGVDRAAEGST